MREQESNGKSKLTTGDIIDGKWIIMEKIGKGGMGEVFRAHQLDFHSLGIKSSQFGTPISSDALSSALD